MLSAHTFTRPVPVTIGVGGPRRNLALRACEATLPAILCSTITTPLGVVHLDLDEPAERLLGYAFHNVLRYYRTSPLGRYITGTRWPNAATFVDVGANLGLYSAIARTTGLAAYAVEPEPRHAAFLHRNTPTFGELVEVALSDRPGALPLYYEKDNPGATSLMPATGYMEGTGTVAVSTFTDVAAEGSFGDPDSISLVKIDVEGSEASTIAGMDGFFAGGHRPHIWCEVRGDRSGRNGGSFRKVTAALAAHGYEPLEPGRRRGYRKPSDGEVAGRAVFDLLFVAR